VAPPAALKHVNARKAGVINSPTSFQTDAREKWNILTDKRSVTHLPLEDFCLRIIEMFPMRYVDKSDLFCLLSRFVFTTIPGLVDENDFLQLYANFGQRHHLFPKMVNLLRANRDYEFLVMECLDRPTTPVDRVVVYFSRGERFGFVVLWPDGRTMHIRNDFECSIDMEYLIDEQRRRYKYWENIIR
jgi:hypothetical protein